MLIDNGERVTINERFYVINGDEEVIIGLKTIYLRIKNFFDLALVNFVKRAEDSNSSECK